MLNQGFLKSTAQQSVLGESSILAPKGTRTKRSISADLLLTALIDAFSILVIFLLMSFSSSGDILFIGKGMELPKAAQAEMLERNPVIKVDQGRLLLEDKEVASNDLTASLLDLRKRFLETHPNSEYPSVLTVQADRRVRYDILNQIVVAASQSGVSDIKFAILMK